MKDLYYQIAENGYHIYDRNDSLFHIYQYEPYIPNQSKTYEENAQFQIEELMKMDTTTDEQALIDSVTREVSNG